MLRRYTFEEAQESFEKYPYFFYPAVSALENSTPSQRAVLVRRIAACVGNEADLRTLLGIDPEEFASFYPDMRPKELTTSDTIDSFLERFASPEAAAATETEELIIAPAVDYATMMAAEEEECDNDNADATSDAISAFLAAVPPKTPKSKPAPKPETKPAPAPEPEETPEPEEAGDSEPISPRDADLSESLARVMIKNGNYRKALEIITELSLKNPKKSIYFADQMRFLHKLIENQDRKARIQAK